MSQIVSRRNFLRSGAITTLMSRSGPAQLKTAHERQNQVLFAGTQTKTSSKGIYAFEWHAQKGELIGLGLAAETNNPTFLALSPDGKRLYAANEINTFEGAKTGSVSGFNIDRAAARLAHINTVAAQGAGTCHVILESTGRTLLCANYAGGSAASFRVEASGHLSEAVSQFHYTGHGPVADRQEASHAHRATVSPDNRYAYINDLGLDCIHIYRLDAATAKLMPGNPAQWTAKPGSGPRALRFHPNGKWAICIHELACAIEMLAWNSGNGAFESIDRVELLPSNVGALSRASEVVFDHAGRFAYAAVREYDHIVAFVIDPSSGKLQLLDRTSCGGNTPRHIAMDPTDRWLLVANEGSDNIAVLSRDAQTGKLAADGASASFPLVKPQCLLFA